VNDDKDPNQDPSAPNPEPIGRQPEVLKKLVESLAAKTAGQVPPGQVPATGNKHLSVSFGPNGEMITKVYDNDGKLLDENSSNLFKTDEANAPQHVAPQPYQFQTEEAYLTAYREWAKGGSLSESELPKELEGATPAIGSVEGVSPRKPGVKK
jgi:hypothetical protein